jgi:tRNA (cytidine/uridine-2'-O-)-methyltransferase
MERHVVLVAPQIHWNTGNIGRTCLGAGAALHLIEPLGFSLDARQVERAGLDYWPQVNLHIWTDFDAFTRSMTPQPHEMALLTKNGSRCYRSLASHQRLFLIFGSETAGLPAHLLKHYPQAQYYIPITSAIRCLNLSTAVGIVLYHSLAASCRKPLS